MTRRGPEIIRKGLGKSSAYLCAACIPRFPTLSCIVNRAHKHVHASAHALTWRRRLRHATTPNRPEAYVSVRDSRLGRSIACERCTCKYVGQKHMHCTLHACVCTRTDRRIHGTCFCSRRSHPCILAKASANTACSCFSNCMHTKSTHEC
jgi:hypothetical protein